MPFLSIIIPIYKVEPYLRECLDSVAASPLDCWEAILVDDGSPDGCPQICDEYAAKDKRFRVIHQKNAGVAAARNAGLDAAQGEWVWFVDSDDVVDMRPVGDIVKWLRNNDNDTGQSSYDTLKPRKADATKTVDVPVDNRVDLVMFDLETFKDGESIECKSSQLQVVDEHLSKNDFLMKHICYHHPRLWYRRETMHDLCFSVGIRVGEDLEFQYKFLTLCRRPFKFDMTLYYYRLRETSATGDAAYRRKVVEDLPVVLHNLAAWCKEHHVKPERWYDYRIRKLLQNLLYSASLVPSLNTKDFQKTLRDVVAVYRRQNFPFVHNKKILLATWSVKAYFLFNRIYLKVTGR